MAVKARRQEIDAGLNINSMMDMMTIILVFLLKSYSASDISIAPSAALTLPSSEAQKAPELAVNLVISRDQILVDGVPVLTLQERQEDDGTTLRVLPEDALRGQLIPKLYDVLDDKAAAAVALGDQIEQGDFSGRLLLQVDRSLHFGVLREVMYTAGQARFGEFEFVVYSNAG